MRIFYLSVLVAGIAFAGSCNSGTSEEETASPAEEINQESINKSATEELADTGEQEDSEFVVEAYSFNLMLKHYGKLALTQENVPEQVKEFAKASVALHEDLNDRIEYIALKNNVFLPKEVGENVEEYSEKLIKMEGPEFAEQYLKTVADIHSEMAGEYEEASNNASDEEIRSMAASALPVIREREEQIDQLEEIKDQREGRD